MNESLPSHNALNFVVIAGQNVKKLKTFAPYGKRTHESGKLLMNTKGFNKQNTKALRKLQLTERTSQKATQ